MIYVENLAHEVSAPSDNPKRLHPLQFWKKGYFQDDRKSCKCCIGAAEGEGGCQQGQILIPQKQGTKNKGTFFSPKFQK